MTNLTAKQQINRVLTDDMVEMPIAAAVEIFAGAIVSKNIPGYATPNRAPDEVIGIAYEGCDNSAGAAGAENIRVVIQGDYVFTLASAAVADIGKCVFAPDDSKTLLRYGHPKSFVGRIIALGDAANTVVVRLKRSGEMPSNDESDAIWLADNFIAPIAPTGAVAATNYGRQFIYTSALGLGVLQDTNGGADLQFDAVAEVAHASIETPALFDIDRGGATFTALLNLEDIADSNTMDADWGFGTALTANSRADADHADMAQLAVFHMDGNSANILAQSDDATTDVAPVDTTIDNVLTAGTGLKRFDAVVRPTGAVEFYIDRARVLASTTFAVLSTAVLAAFVLMEKTANDTTALLHCELLEVGGVRA